MVVNWALFGILSSSFWTLYFLLLFMLFLSLPWFQKANLLKYRKRTDRCIILTAEPNEFLPSSAAFWSLCLLGPIPNMSTFRMAGQNQERLDPVWALDRSFDSFRATPILVFLSHACTHVLWSESSRGHFGNLEGRSPWCVIFNYTYEWLMIVNRLCL